MVARNVIKDTLDTISRSALADSLSIVKPALGKIAFVPVLGHFCFDGEWVTAYDDMIAISVKHKLPVTCAVPADLLLKFMGSLSGDDMSMRMEGAALELKCGRATMKVPTLGPDSFIFKRDFKGKRRAEIEDLDGSVIQGISRCLLSVGQDATHPAQMGITIVGDENGDVTLYSTDNVTMSQCPVHMEIGKGQTAILPTAFCQNLVALHEKLGEDDECDFVLYDTCAVARFGDWGLLFTKLVTTDKTLDFDAVMNRLIGDYTSKDATDLPDGWVPAFQRAGACADPSRPLTSMATTKTALHINTESKLGECHDMLGYEGRETKAFLIDPLHVLRASPMCKQYALLPDVLVMQDGQFLHMISHCVK
jgi:hypothetical protein